ncbi:MAG: dCMP deaminase family protein [Pseudomonadota bacterium]
MSGRPGKEEYYLNIAREVCKRGTCLRRQYGAVIVNDDQIVSTGYAGAPRGVANCVDLGRCLREDMAVPPGERYELCRSVHAEMNAVIHASRAQTMHATLYLVGLEVASGLLTVNPEPCLLCRRVIINAGITSVVVQPRDRGIVRLNPEDWIKEENEAARQGLVAPACAPLRPEGEGGGVS